MSRRFILTIAAGFVLIFAFGVAAVIGVNNLGTSTGGVKSASVITPQSAPAQVVASVPVAPQPLAPSNPVAVQRSDINKLAAAVKLGTNQSVNKDVWVRETPVAAKLENAMCDCDQRNWLKHFVETGNDAISGSPHFDESLHLLATLRKDDGDLAQAPH
jgi:hypothetical protein